MKNLIVTLFIFLLCLTAAGQQKAPGGTIVPNGAKSQFKKPLSLQILAGSQGIGADFKYGFNSKISGRVGFSIIPIDVDKAFTFSGFDVQGLLSSKFSNVHLMADYSPFNNRNFRIVGGASYLIEGSANAMILPSNGYSFGNQAVTKDQIGTLNAEVSWDGIAPYLGLGFFKSFPNKLFNINLDLGTYYVSSPNTSFTGSKMLSDNEENAKRFNENMKGYRWLPVVQLNFNFRLN
ncbi:MAG: hypothetical protein V4594_00495 [Bacteroidota bacterium]